MRVVTEPPWGMPDDVPVRPWWTLLGLGIVLVTLTGATEFVKAVWRLVWAR